MTDYGQRMNNALQAVRRMHADASRLLQDCDGTIGDGRESIYGNYATRDLTYSVRARHYMAEGLFRLYDATRESPGLVEGLSIYFFDDKQLADEPTLVVGQIKYHLDGDNQIKTVCREWDLWRAYFEWSDQRPDDHVITPDVKEERIERVKVIGVPLYSVDGMPRVVDLMERVRKASLNS